MRSLTKKLRTTALLFPWGWRAHHCSRRLWSLAARRSRALAFCFSQRRRSFSLVASQTVEKALRSFSIRAAVAAFLFFIDRSSLAACPVNSHPFFVDRATRSVRSV